MTRQQRLRRALREPDRLRTALIWNASRQYNRRRAQLALRLRRPLPERLREQFFFDLHFDAERAYDPVPYARDMLVFHGDGLYEEPELGWGGLAEGGVTTYAVPGDHRNNRQAMAEPAVGFVSERIQEYLARR